jgi:FtsZ family, C-terminal domain
MLDGAACLRQSRAVGVIILGGPALAMIEVNRIMEQVHDHCEAVPVMMGACIVPELGESLSVALLVAKPGDPDEQESPAPEAARAGLLARAAAAGIEGHFLNGTATPRPGSRFLPPAPTLAADQMNQLLARQRGTASRGRKNPSKFKQAQLPLEIVSKGRFDKSEPTIHKGEDLDVPTYIRRGMALN